MADDATNSRKIASETLARLENGSRLPDILPDVIKIAALSGHIAERAWLRFQAADTTLKNGELIPGDLFDIWRQIDTEFGPIDLPRRTRLNVQSEYVDSRTPQGAPDKVWRCTLSALEDIVEKCDLYERESGGNRAADPDLVKSCAMARDVYGRIRGRIQAYLSQGSAPAK